MLRITRLEVVRYRQLVALEPCTLGKPTVIVGSNGIGKSTLLRALQFLVSGSLSEQDRVSGELEVRGDFVDLDGATLRVRRVLDGDGGVRLELRTRVPEEPGLRDLDAMTAAELRATIDTHLPDYSGNRARKASMCAALEEHALTLAQVDDWALAGRDLEDRLPLGIIFASTEEPDPEEEVRRSLDGTFKLFRASEQFRRRLDELEQEAGAHLDAASESIRETVALRCADLGQPELTADVSITNTFRGIALTIGSDADKRPLAALGAGERRRITLAVWEATAAAFQAIDEEADGPVRQRVVVYDEPDTHLDYFRQRELMTLLLDQASRPNDCVVVATHSRNLVDGVDPDSIVALRHDESGAVEAVSFLGGDVEDHVADVVASIGVSNSTLLNENCFVVVEGPSEIAAFPSLYRHCCGRRHHADGIVFLPVGGNSAALKVAKLLKDIGRTVYVLVDRDCTTHEQTRKQFGPDALKRHGLEDDLLLLGRDGDPSVEELEGLFSDEQWASALNVASPRIDGRMWLASDVAELRGETKFSTSVEQMVHANSGLGATKPALARAVAEQCIRDDAVPDELAAALRTVSGR